MTTTFRADALERIAATVVQAAVGAVTAPQLVDALSLPGWTVAPAIAAVAAGLAAVKAWAARRVGDPQSASLLPAEGAD